MYYNMFVSYMHSTSFQTHHPRIHAKYSKLLHWAFCRQAVPTAQY